MTLLDRLQAHRGGLLRIKSELFWYDGGGWDGNPGRICLVLDALLARATTHRAVAATAADTAIRTHALLLIDGAARWVWVAAKDIELLDGDHR